MTIKTAYRHWIDELVSEILDYWEPGTKTINCSCGLSMSGLQHVGRLRGEVTITNTIMHLLRDEGIKTQHNIVRYTSDPWKGKQKQITQFPDPDKATNYIGWRLIDVPDPQGEFANWPERYWQEFGGALDHFSRDSQILSTHEIYTWPKMQDLVKFAIEHRDQVREVVNKYRPRNPRSSDWIPIEVVCEQCKRINAAKVIAVDLDAYTADYHCSNCGNTGNTSITNGKLSWRVEWAALWKVLKVGFEPFGKDHATPGGSRDSAKEISETIFKFKAPAPFAYEWVGLIEGGVDKGDMGSSDFLGFTPHTYLSVASGLSLRYLFLKNKPMRRITLGLEFVPNYVGQYDRAERLYYGQETSKAPAEEQSDIRRSYELAQLDPIPSEAPLQIPYLHAVVLGQILPDDDFLDIAITKLTDTAQIPTKLTEPERTYVYTRLKRAKTWASTYAPDSYRFHVIDQPPPNLNKDISPELRQLFQALHNQLNPTNWTEQAITNTMKAITLPLRKNKSLQYEFFRLIYQAFFGRNEGPRIAPFFAFTDPVLVKSRLQFLALSAS